MGSRVRGRPAGVSDEPKKPGAAETARAQDAARAQEAAARDEAAAQAERTAAQARATEIREVVAVTDERRAEEEVAKAEEAKAAAEKEEAKREQKRREAEERRKAAAAESERAREQAAKAGSSPAPPRRRRASCRARASPRPASASTPTPRPRPPPAPRPGRAARPARAGGRGGPGEARDLGRGGLRRRVPARPHPQGDRRLMPDQSNSELAKAIQDVTEKAQLLVREEVALAKAEMSEKVSKLVKGAIFGVVAGVFAPLRPHLPAAGPRPRHLGAAGVGHELLARVPHRRRAAPPARRHRRLPGHAARQARLAADAPDGHRGGAVDQGHAHLPALRPSRSGRWRAPGGRAREGRR